MSSVNVPGTTSTDSAPQCSRDAILAACVEPQRRKLLFALAMGGAQTGADAMNYGKQRVRRDHPSLDLALKHLAVMAESGMVVRQSNPSDGRRPLYSLPSWVKVTVTSEGVEVDYGSYVIRLRADGK